MRATIALYLMGLSSQVCGATSEMEVGKHLPARPSQLMDPDDDTMVRARANGLAPDVDLNEVNTRSFNRVVRPRKTMAISPEGVPSEVSLVEDVPQPTRQSGHDGQGVSSERAEPKPDRGWEQLTSIGGTMNAS